MKRRLNLAAALLHDPQVLLLDEPTVGVDPQSRNAIFDNLETLKQRGKTLLYTTHYMEEAERLCDRIVILDHGRVIADDTLQGLVSAGAGEQHDRDRVRGPRRDGAGRAAARAGRRHPRGGPAPGALRVGVTRPVRAPCRPCCAGCADHGHPYRHVVDRAGQTSRPVFLTLTGRTLRD